MHRRWESFCGRTELQQGWKQPGMRRKEADHHRVAPLHLPYVCCEKGDSRLVYGFFFSCLEMCVGCCAQVLAVGSAEKPLWGAARLLQVGHSPFQMTPMAPPLGMAEPRSQHRDILGEKASIPTWTNILWFYYSDDRVQLCNMNIISLMNYNSFRQVEV